MRLSIENGTLYADNVFLCYLESGNGCNGIRPGRYEVATQFSHEHSRELPLATGLGWLGASRECDIVLGRVRHRHGVVPSSFDRDRLISMLEAAEEFGSAVVLEVSTK